MTVDSNFPSTNIAIVLGTLVVIVSITLVVISIYFQRKRIKQIYKLPEALNPAYPLSQVAAKEPEKLINIEHPRTELPPVVPIKPGKA